MEPQIYCPSCNQPASAAMSDDGCLECTNEACPQYGEKLTMQDPQSDAAPKS